MLSPYDWQEAMSNRVSYILGRIERGAPVVGVSLNAGILLFTYRRQSKKLFEIYDRLAFAGLGQQSDIESIRVLAVEFAHREGFSRSEQDVTINRVVTSVSGPIKKAFADLSYAPILAMSVFAEIGASPNDDCYFQVDFDGDYHLLKNSFVLSSRKQTGIVVHDRIAARLTPEKALVELQKIWHEVASSGGEEEVVLEGLVPEALLIERDSSRENRFVELSV